MDDYISRQKVERFIENGLNNPDKKKAFGHDAVEILTEVHYMESADVRPVKRGEWIETGYFDQYYQPIYECSHCHREVADNFMAKHLFCLHCGADMRPDGGADG